MLSNDRITAKLGPSGEEPEWRPLLDLVGPDIVGYFMWMCPLVLPDGTRMHAYKHHDTRRYLHIHEDGRLFEYDGAGGYLEISPTEALAEAFTSWEIVAWPEDDPGPVFALLARHRVDPRVGRAR